MLTRVMFRKVMLIILMTQLSIHAMRSTVMDHAWRRQRIPVFVILAKTVTFLYTLSFTLYHDQENCISLRSIYIDLPIVSNADIKVWRKHSYQPYIIVSDLNGIKAGCEIVVKYGTKFTSY